MFAKTSPLISRAIGARGVDETPGIVPSPARVDGNASRPAWVRFATVGLAVGLRAPAASRAAARALGVPAVSSEDRACSARPTV